MQYDASSSSAPIKYVSLNMTGGAKCVMTGEGRTSEVSACARFLAARVCSPWMEIFGCAKVVVMCVMIC